MKSFLGLLFTAFCALAVACVYIALAMPRDQAGNMKPAEKRGKMTESDLVVMQGCILFFGTVYIVGPVVNGALGFGDDASEMIAFGLQHRPLLEVGASFSMIAVHLPRVMGRIPRGIDYAMVASGSAGIIWNIRRFVLAYLSDRARRREMTR